VTGSQLLANDERQQLLNIPTDEISLHRLYTLPPHEQAYVRRALEPHTVLDRALHLSLFKWPGTGFVLGQHVPAELPAFLARQLKISVRAFRQQGRISQAHSRMARDAATFLGMRSATTDTVASITTWAAAEATHTDDAWKITDALLRKLREEKIIIPAWDTLERAVGAGMQRAKTQAIQNVLALLSDGQRKQLDVLVRNDPNLRQTPLVWLRNVKETAKVSHLRHVIERRAYLQALAIPPAISTSITPWQFNRLVQRGNRARAMDIVDYADDHRHAVLAAQVLHLLTVLSDGGVDMFNTLIAGVFNGAVRTNEERYLSSRNDTVELAHGYRGLVKTLRSILEDGIDPRDALASTLGWETMLKLDHTAEAFTVRTDQDTLLTVCEHFARLGNFVPDFLDTFTFAASNPSNPLLSAITIVRDTFATGKPLPADAPVSFLPETWRRLLKVDGKLDRKRYITAVAATIRDRLRSGDLTVEGTSQYQPFDHYLVPLARVPELAHRLPFNPNVDAYLAEREDLLRERLQRFGERLHRHELEGVRLAGGKISTTPLDNTSTPEIERASEQIGNLLPRKRLGELFHELHGDTEVFNRFVDAEGRPHHDVKVVMAAVWGLASGLGLERIAEASPGITVGQLEWATATFITEKTLDRAILLLVEHQSRLPFARYSGDGTTSSSDGQFVPVGRRPTGSGAINPKYGPAPGVKVYTHINDQYMAFHTRVLSASAPEAPFVLDGLVTHAGGLVIREHFTDTGGASDHIFAGCRLIDVRFMPRYRDMPDLKFGYIGSTKTLKGVEGLLGRRIRTDLIRDYWPDILRLGISFAEETVLPSVILRRLATFRQQNQFAAALQEFGRIERSLFMLDWLENPEIRRQTQVGLNKGESQHFLGDAIRLNNHGRLLDRTHENQTLRSKAAAFVAVAIVCSNTKDLDAVTRYLAANGQAVSEDILQHISPLGWKHIMLTGQYNWDKPRHAKGVRYLLRRKKNEGV
jgi:TnpA family transposase